MAIDSVETLDARTVVGCIRKEEFSTAEYVASLLHRYEAFTYLNSIISIDRARLLDEARSIDHKLSQGVDPGPLTGLPFAVKDQIDVAGYPTTMGHAHLKQYVASKNAAIVDTVRSLGGIIFAKTNCGPMVGGYPGRPMSAVLNNNPYFGAVRNPYNPDHVSGGSSGGNAAAVAGRLVPAAIGEDTGGSIRIPAAFCGVAGFRPSTFTVDNALGRPRQKRYPDAGVLPPAGFAETVGPMARTVADIAFIDTAVTGDAAQKIDLRGARIGVPDAGFWEAAPCDPAVRDAFIAVLTRVEGEAGAKLVPLNIALLATLGRAVPLPLGRAEGAFDDWLSANVPGMTLARLNSLPRCSPSRSADPSLAVRHPLAGDSTRTLTRFNDQYVGTFRSHNLSTMVLPSQSILAPLVNFHEDRMDQMVTVDGVWIEEFEAIVRNTWWGAAMGAPSLSLPMGLVAGLPAGLLVQGLPGDDSAVLAFGGALEEVLGQLPPPP